MYTLNIYTSKMYTIMYNMYVYAFGHVPSNKDNEQHSMVHDTRIT